jgi:phospholipid/cholesterol/gamma-HCH transport system permease protein
LFTVERAEKNGCAELRFSGRLALREGNDLWREIHGASGAPDAMRIDLSEVESVDGASAALLVAMQVELAERGAALEFTGARREVQRMLDLYACPEGVHCLKAPPRNQGLLAQVGGATVEIAIGVLDVFAFIGQMTRSLGAALRAPRTVNWRDVGRLMERAGADGLPIVLLINFLIGLIMALQASPMFQQYGAGIFVADLVGLSTTRELAPLMTAIIVCGRSGAAFAAELGTMKVSEEVDALRTLGLDPQRYLVFPRVLALVLVVPLLTVLADVVGCLGGLAVAIYRLDLTPVTYLNQLQGAVGLGDVFVGLFKSGVFAMAITFIACQRGLSTRGGAEGVGRSTTGAVVVTLFSLVCLDALFTVLFHFLQI